VGLLQNRCLRILAPSSGFHEEKENPKSPERRKKLSSQPSSLPTTKQHFVNQEDRPTRPSKIRRPISIRRPKLIGKSVEGAAMQAVAASRKRASSNQFRNAATIPTPVKRPPNQKIIYERSRGSLSKNSQKDSTASHLPKAPQNHKEQEEQDEHLNRLKNDFSSLHSSKNNQILRRSSLQSTALLRLISLWWPQKKVHGIPKTVVHFLISKAPLAWSDTRPFPPLPRGTEDFFIGNFARFIAAFNPSLQLLPLTSSKRSGSQRYDSAILFSDIKNVRGCKVMVAVKISKVVSKRLGKVVVRCQGMILNLPRRGKIEQRLKVGANIKATLASEKDSAGMDKLASNLHVRCYLYNSFLSFEGCKFTYHPTLLLLSNLWYWTACFWILVHQ
jgi:hypothetical protein